MLFVQMAQLKNLEDTALCTGDIHMRKRKKKKQERGVFQNDRSLPDLPVRRLRYGIHRHSSAVRKNVRFSSRIQENAKHQMHICIHM